MHIGGGREQVTTFFHEDTFTATHVAADPQTKRAAIVDSVLDFDSASGRTSTEAADELIGFVRDNDLAVDWLIETHAHADHLSAAPFLQEKLGGKLAIGRDDHHRSGRVRQGLQRRHRLPRDGSQFDRLLGDGDGFSIGDIPSSRCTCPATRRPTWPM
jgi:glyoxylase-like metal-dependent hydrolase (beta-lactamase superfamily II)